MTPAMMRYALGSLCLSGWLSLQAADESARRFEHTNEQFAITLTGDWKQVTPKTAPYADEVLAPESDVVSVAYQLGSQTNGAALVYVQIDNNWRVPEIELARLQIDFLRRRFLTERMEVEGLLDSTYNTNGHVLRISSTPEFSGVGKMRVLEAIHFTERGSFTVSCVAPVDQFKSVTSTFARALDTFHIDPSLAYRPRPGAEKQVASTSRPQRTKIRFGFICGLASVALFIVHRLSNRVMSDEI